MTTPTTITSTSITTYSVTYHGERGCVVRAGVAFPDAVRWAAARPHVTGPNGPVAYCEMHRADGTFVESWPAEARRLGYVPLYRTDYAGRETMVGVE